MLREMVKWDYELRMGPQAADVVARAVEVSMAHPRGPTYLVLPREPLAAPLAEPIGPIKPRPLAAGSYPDPHVIATLAEWLAAAERPLIIAGTLSAGAVPALAHLAERCAIPVITYNPRSVSLPSSHSMHFGSEPGTLLAHSDLVIVLESDVPWISSLQKPAGRARVAHIGEEPFFVRYPMRSFPSDLVIQASAENVLNEFRLRRWRNVCKWRKRASQPAVMTYRTHAQPARPTRPGRRARRVYLAGISLASDRRDAGRGCRYFQ